MSERLAIHGGTPVRSARLPYGHHIVGEEDRKAVEEALRSDWLTTGPAVSRFEEAFARVTGSAEAVAVANGTAALHAAVFAAGIGPGDEVIVPPLTFVATSNAVLYQGGSVVFADILKDRLTLDPEAVERAVTGRTRGIIAVDFAGQPADLAELRDIAVRHGAVLIEDASHALGASYRERRVGSISDLTTFSFHPVKVITTGEGGMITTDDSSRAGRMRGFRNHGIGRDAHQRERTESWMYEMTVLGWNYRLTDLQSALGLAQLQRLDGWIRRRGEIAASYDRRLADLPEIELPSIAPGRTSAWHLYVLRLHLERLNTGREEIFRALRAEGIGVNVHYIPVPWHPYYQNLGYERGRWPVTEAEYERMLTLPVWPGMSDQDVEDVTTAVRKVVRYYSR